MSYQEDYMGNGMMRHQRWESEQNARYPTKNVREAVISIASGTDCLPLSRSRGVFNGLTPAGESLSIFGFVFREIFQGKPERMDE
jgi:hypothetical protein